EVARLRRPVLRDGEFQRDRPAGHPSVRRPVDAEEPAARAALPRFALRQPDAAVDRGALPGAHRPRGALRRGRIRRLSARPIVRATGRASDMWKWAPPQRGSVLSPMRYSSTARAAWRPSRIAHTTSDC